MLRLCNAMASVIQGVIAQKDWGSLKAWKFENKAGEGEKHYYLKRL